MSAFLIDTLVWTGALLALVLLIRRPVAQVFGPMAAYALWTLPMARLLLPPIVLPSWMAPTAEPLVTAPVPAELAPMSGEAVVATAPSALPLAMDAGVAVEPTLFDSLVAFDWMSLLLPLWLTGAGVFLIRRYALYFRMRRELLASARPVGEAGRVRMIETPAADGPVAFGVLDKVVALPMGFMAGHDRAARDLALAHELAHHRGHDLFCNMLVQPLFALHWFNPLAMLGWRALRRDQEAACDARVMALESRERRAAYAAVIARFATQPKHAARLALAAPMACPVLGDRSIVQRLKSLSMNDISARRRWSGRALIATGALALPLTGSITYAQAEFSGARMAEIAPIAPLAPIPPMAPVPTMATIAPLPGSVARAPVALTAPTAPTAPVAPIAPVAPVAPRFPVIGGLHGDIVFAVHGGATDAQAHSGQGRRVTRSSQTQSIVTRDGVTTINGRVLNDRERAEFDRAMADYRRGMQAYERGMAEYNRDMADHARDMADHARDMAELQRELAENQVEIDREVARAMAEAGTANRVAALAIARAPRVVSGCRSGQREVSETVTVDGKERIYVCNRIALEEARRGLAQARNEIGRNPDMSSHERAMALRALNQAEEQLRAD